MVNVSVVKRFVHEFPYDLLLLLYVVVAVELAEDACKTFSNPLCVWVCECLEKGIESF